MKATDMKGNKRIFLPKAMENDLEARIEVRRMEGKKIYKECMDLHGLKRKEQSIP